MATGAEWTADFNKLSDQDQDAIVTALKTVCQTWAMAKNELYLNQLLNLAQWANKRQQDKRVLEYKAEQAQALKEGA
jgi:hypothetical protein